MTDLGLIVGATDLSSSEPDGDVAVRQACQLARRDQRRLLLLHVFPDLMKVSMLFPQAHADLTMRLAEARAGALEELTRLAGALEGCAARPVLEDGPVADRIVQLAIRRRASLVVVGAGARGDGLGPVASQVLRHAPCPVLIARDGRAAGPVLAATDLSDPAVPAIAAARQEAASRDAALSVVHVVEPLPALVTSATPTPLDARVQDDLRDAAARGAETRLREALGRAGIDGAEAVITHGLAAERIVELATSTGARLVVVGTLGRTGAARLLLGSVAEEVARRAPCSVLAVRLHRSRRAMAAARPTATA